MRSKQGRNRVTEICTARIFPGWKQIRGFIWHPHITWEMADQCPMVPRCRWIIRHTCRKNTGGKKHSVHCEWHRLPWEGSQGDEKSEFQREPGTQFRPHNSCDFPHIFLAKKDPRTWRHPGPSVGIKRRQGSSTEGYANSMDTPILANLRSWKAMFKVTFCWWKLIKRKTFKFSMEDAPITWSEN